MNTRKFRSILFHPGWIGSGYYIFELSRFVYLLDRSECTTERFEPISLESRKKVDCLLSHAKDTVYWNPKCTFVVCTAE